MPCRSLSCWSEVVELISGESFHYAGFSLIFLIDRIPWDICSLPHPPVKDVYLWLWKKYIQETLALPFRQALKQINLFEGVCVESQVFCTLQDFFCHCHLFCCRLFVLLLLVCDYTDGLAICLCLSPWALSLFAGTETFFLSFTPPSLLLIAQQLRGKCSVSEPGSSARLPRHRYLSLGFRMQGGWWNSFQIQIPDPYHQNHSDQRPYPLRRESTWVVQF